ncbi:GNAT family N-acetyltransferase [Motilimonas cestriensis]|uniref:GNAT family N-acetyltransferase n=1 Tax=Motilimonas cestriensis TaxID=2742685 RepID=UPI003DA62211
MDNNRVILSAANCLITPLTCEDAHLIHAYQVRNRRHLAPWDPSRSQSFFELATWQKVLTANQENWQRGNAFHFAAIDEKSGEMIASINFSAVMRGVFQACYLGYSIDQAHQGQGKMQAICQVCINYMFDQQNLHRIMAAHILDNHRSERLLLKLGFEYEGLAKKYLKIAGQWQDHKLYALINPQHH